MPHTCVTTVAPAHWNAPAARCEACAEQFAARVVAEREVVVCAMRDADMYLGSNELRASVKRYRDAGGK